MRVLITVSIVGQGVTEPTFSFGLFAPEGVTDEDALARLEDLRDEYLKSNDGIFEPEGYIDYVSQYGFDAHQFCNHLTLDITERE